MSKTIFLFFVVLTSLSLITGCTEDDTTTTPTGGNSAPNSPSNPLPPDGAVNVSRLVTLSWTCTDPNPADTLRFDVAAGTTNPPVNLVANNILNSSVDIGIVAANTTIYWKVTAKDNNNAFTEGPVWSFTTGN